MSMLRVKGQSGSRPTSVENFLYQTDLPELSEFTGCFWYEGVPDRVVDKQAAIFSIAAAGSYKL